MTGSGLAQLQGTTLEIIAFHLGDQQFCIKTTSIREIRGWAAATPLPHAPPHILGVMNLRGSVIPIIDLAAKLGVHSTTDTARAAIVVAEVGRTVVGLVVDQVSDILSIGGNQIQPVPDLGTGFDASFSYGIIPLERGMVCFLDLDHMFDNLEDCVKVAWAQISAVSGRDPYTRVRHSDKGLPPMTAPSPFLQLEPANLNDGPHNTVDARTTEAFEQQRDRILHITNYMEALHARLLVSTNGRPSVATVRDED